MKSNFIRSIDSEDLTEDQKRKLMKFNLAHVEVIAEWRKFHGSNPPPIYWNEEEENWEWASRTTRRNMEKIKRKMARKAKTVVLP